MSKNIKKLQITFSKVYNNPTFADLFSRLPQPIEINKVYEFSTNHTHYGKILDMQSNFKCYEVKDITC